MPLRRTREINSFVSPSLRGGFFSNLLGGESVVATSAGLVERRSARPPGHLIIDSNAVAPPLNEVASLSVDGLNKSAIARVKRVAFHEKARCCQDRISKWQ